MEEVLSAQYFTRLLRGPDDQLWRVVLGMHGCADLIDPRTGASRPSRGRPATRGRGSRRVWIEKGSFTCSPRAAVARWVAGSCASTRGHCAVLEGDRDWNTAAVSPDGAQWVALDAEDATVLLYTLTKGQSNR